MATRFPIYLLLSLLFTVTFLKGIAQRDSVQIKALITDSVASPVPWATVSFLKNGALLFSRVADDKGRFSAYLKKEQATDVRITDAAHQPVEKKLNWAGIKEQQIDLGTIVLPVHQKSLQQVTVTAAKPLILREADRLIYNLDADPDSKVSNVTDMMRKVPFITVDAQENILLKGNSDYRIFINGKPSGMMDHNAKNILKTMPASTIQKIEVITHPSSKYDAEGTAGIINIVTVKKLIDGYNGSVNVNATTPTGGPGAGFSLTAQSGKWGANIFGGGNLYNNPSVASTMTRMASGNKVQENNSSTSEGRNGYAGVELSFEADSLNLFTLQANTNGGRSEQERLQNSRATVTGENQSYDFNNQSAGKNSGADASFNYQRNFKNDKNRLLTTSYKYMQFDGANEGAGRFANRVNYDFPDFKLDNKSFTNEQTAQVDYTQRFGKMDLEAGLKGIFRLQKSDYSYFSFNTAIPGFEEDPGNSNGFTNHLNIYGAYTTLFWKLKKWDYRIGARAEQTTTRARFTQGESSLNRNYFNLIPAVLINRK